MFFVILVTLFLSILIENSFEGLMRVGVSSQVGGFASFVGGGEGYLIAKGVVTTPHPRMLRVVVVELCDREGGDKGLLAQCRYLLGWSEGMASRRG